MAERWLVEFGRLRVRVADFAWRRRALECHDLHHALTGYALSPTGEMEIAAWEFAAGPYPSPWTYLMCLPLVGAGSLLIPRRTFAAYVFGRHCRTLYAAPRALSESEIRAWVLPAAPPETRFGDVARYIPLVLLGITVLLSPLVLLILFFATPEIE